jgi:hypothetical protein
MDEYHTIDKNVLETLVSDRRLLFLESCSVKTQHLPELYKYEYENIFASGVMFTINLCSASRYDTLKEKTN